MKLPEKIKGRNRVRDAKIVSLWSLQDVSYEKIAERFGITVRRVQQILYDNHTFVEYNKAWEKKKRIKIINRLIEKKQDKTNKDIIDLLDAQRKEIEGDDSSRGPSGTQIIIIRSDGDKQNQNKSQPIPRQVSIQSS